MKPLYVKKNGVVYKISGNGMPALYPAENVEYDNTVTSELQATDVQGAIDELSTRQGGVQSDWNENDNTELDYIKNKPENLVQDANYVHTDNNYDATAKGKVDSLGTASTKDVGVANGVAELDSAGKVPSSQLPSFVDDVIEVADYDHLPITGESGKIYVTLDTNKTYRWSGSSYVEISASLTLGETSSTAYRGDRGKTAYDHATESGKISSAVTSGLYKVAATAEGHIAGLTAVTKDDITGLGIPGSDTNDKVTQTASNTNANYEVLFSGTNDNTTRTEGAKKNSNLTFNPFTGLLLLNYFGTSPDITSRLTSLNFAPNTVAPGTGRMAMRLDLATSSVTEGKPLSGVAGYVHTYYWDGGAAMTQIYIPNGDHVWTRNGPQGIMMRGYDGTDAEWKDWEYIPFMSEAPTSGQVLIADGTSGKIKTSGYTIAKSVPSNAVFTDTDTKVTQTNSSTNGNYRLLLSGSNNDTTETTTSNKSSKFTANPSTGLLTTNKIKSTINNSVLTGTGTAAQDKGASANPRYFPAKWQFNTGYNPSEGDIITIALPVAGHGWGDWISINNGSTWHPANFQGTGRLTTHFSAGQVVQFVFDADGSTASMTPVDGANSVNGSTITGGCWRVVNMYDSNSNTIPSAYCDTAAATAAKAASCSAYALLDKSYIHVLIRYANTSASAITMNINGTGAKAIYINGAASSASNYTLPAGTYLVYYASNIFYFRTDGKLTADITGNAATVNGLTVQTAVPSGAKFTDTNNAVTQTATDTSDANYEVLFSVTADNTTRTEGARKSQYFKYNSLTQSLMVGNGCVASGSYSHAFGYQTTSSGIYAFAFGEKVKATNEDAVAEGYQTSATGVCSHAEGNKTLSYGGSSHAEGVRTTAYGGGSHTEGQYTSAQGRSAHAEGYYSTAAGSSSDYTGITHAEGYQTLSSGGYGSHAEGQQTTASGQASHAEGYQTAATSTASHAEGTSTTASGYSSHAEGSNTSAYGLRAHAEGYYSKASGDSSHAEGENTLAKNNGTHAAGYATTASNAYSRSIGHFNAAMTNGGNAFNTTGTAFVIGNGTATTALKNAFSVQFNGVVKAASTITASTTADYAEYFEWADENPNNEDRVGYFVTFDDGDKIRFATSEDDYILGVTSGEPFVLGNGDCDVWNGMVLRDEFRRIIYEPAPDYIEIKGGGRIPHLDKDGNPVYNGTRPKLNPNYDPSKPYINRADRPEWCPVGMLGVLAVRDDGTCEVNGYATITDNAIATKYTGQNQNKYRVIKRNTENVVEIVFR